ncbi:MAG TPA: hypothetical protein VH985_11250 [Candidatus Binatia bacterium]
MWVRPPPGAFIRQPSFRSIREDFWNFTCSDLALNGPPETGSKNLAVMFEQCGQSRLWESQELQKFLGKNVVLTHGEPRFGGDFFLRSSRLRQFAKIAIGKETKLIVVVKDDAAVPGHAKIFGEQITRKNVGRSKVFDRLPVIAPGSRDCLRLVFPEKKVERAKTTLDISVREDDVAALHLHNGSRIAQKLGKQLRVEPVPGDAQMLKFVCFDQSSRAIMFEDQSIAPPHILTGVIFRQIKSIFDQFKNDIVARQRKNAHHHSASSFGHDEAIARLAQVCDEIAVKFRFTVPMKTDGVVKINQPFARHQLLKITHQPIGTFNRHPKIGAGKRKQDRKVDISM